MTNFAFGFPVFFFCFLFSEITAVDTPSQCLPHFLSLTGEPPLVKTPNVASLEVVFSSSTTASRGTFCFVYFKVVFSLLSVVPATISCFTALLSFYPLPIPLQASLASTPAFMLDPERGPASTGPAATAGAAALNISTKDACPSSCSTVHRLKLDEFVVLHV